MNNSDLKQESVITHLRCSISGHAFTPSSTIVVTPSGHTCEKRLLLSKLTENGGIDPFDPTHTLALSEKDLVPLQATHKHAIMPPRPASASSLPNILHMLQEEYDAVILELFDTRSALEETRKELSQALYQNDAAVRVIARLTMERDHARQKLTELSSSTDNRTTETTVVEAEPDDEISSKKRKLDTTPTKNTIKPVRPPEEIITEKSTGIPSEHVDVMVAKWKILSKARRKKTPPPSGHASVEDLKKGLVQTDKKKLHKTSGKAGINCVTIKGEWVLTGANDKAVIVYHRSQNKQIATLTGANKEITCVKAIYSQNLVFSGSADGKIRAYHKNTSDDWNLCGTIPLEKYQNRQSPIVGLEVQPTNKYVLVTSQAGEIAFCVIKGSDDESFSLEHLNSFHAKEGIQYTCTSIHPDGLILGAGTTNGTIELWDLRTQALVSIMNTSTSSNTAESELDSSITALSFSENGYYLLSSSVNGAVIVHDIRKIGSDKSTIARLNSESNPDSFVGQSVHTAQFDPCGKFLAYGGENGSVIVQVKEWDKVLARMDADDEPMVSGLAWSENAKWLATVNGKERVTKFWGEKNIERNNGGDGVKLVTDS